MGQKIDTTPRVNFLFINSRHELCKTTVYYISIFIVHVHFTASSPGRRALAAASGVGNKAPQIDSNVHLPSLVKLVRLGQIVAQLQCRGEEIKNPDAGLGPLENG